MAKISLKELEVLEKEEKKTPIQITEKVVAGKRYFSHPALPPDTWFDDIGEANLAATEAKRQAEYAKDGLDSFGRTKETVAMLKAKSDLLEKKAVLAAEMKKIDLQIQQLKAEDFKEVKKAKK